MTEPQRDRIADAAVEYVRLYEARSVPWLISVEEQHAHATMIEAVKVYEREKGDAMPEPKFVVTPKMLRQHATREEEEARR
ncbi:MAG: hypothetical protein HUU17_12850 [Chthonomonadales bacterium]|nr:hypothetical protein [Chthonomonadales bacterium]